MDVVWNTFDSGEKRPVFRERLRGWEGKSGTGSSSSSININSQGRADGRAEFRYHHLSRSGKDGSAFPPPPPPQFPRCVSVFIQTHTQPTNQPTVSAFKYINTTAWHRERERKLVLSLPPPPPPGLLREDGREFGWWCRVVSLCWSWWILRFNELIIGSMHR